MGIMGFEVVVIRDWLVPWASSAIESLEKKEKEIMSPLHALSPYRGELLNQSISFHPIVEYKGCLNTVRTNKLVNELLIQK